MPNLLILKCLTIHSMNLWNFFHRPGENLMFLKCLWAKTNFAMFGFFVCLFVCLLCLDLFCLIVFFFFFLVFVLFLFLFCFVLVVVVVVVFHQGFDITWKLLVLILVDIEGINRVQKRWRHKKLFLDFSVLDTMYRWSMMKNIHSPNWVGIGSWVPETWPHEYLISPIEISVNWPGSKQLWNRPIYTDFKGAN